MRHWRHLLEDFRRALELNRKEGKKGFTLVELLIVLAIIAILAAIAIPQYNKYRANAMLANVQQLAKGIATDATNLATTSAQNPVCRGIDTVYVYTLTSEPPYNAAQSPADCSPDNPCYLVALKDDKQTACDYNTYEKLPDWVEKVKSELKMTIGGTAVSAEGMVIVLSNYNIGNNKKIGCVYYPNNDTLTDYDATYVCKTF